MPVADDRKRVEGVSTVGFLISIVLNPMFLPAIAVPFVGQGSKSRCGMDGLSYRRPRAHLLRNVITAQRRYPPTRAIPAGTSQSSESVMCTGTCMALVLTSSILAPSLVLRLPNGLRVVCLR